MTRLVVAALLLASSAAHATPLEPMWEGKPCRTNTLVPWRDSLFGVEANQLTRFARATGKPEPAIAVAEPELREVTWRDAMRVGVALGDALIIHDGRVIKAIDVATARTRWRSEPRAGGDTGTSRVHAIAGDVVVVYSSSGLEGIHVERLDGRTGAVAWRADAAPASGQLGWTLDDGARLYAITVPDYAGRRVVASAFDLATGKRLWQTDILKGSVLPFSGQFYAATDGKLFAALPGVGGFAFDGATGKATPLPIGFVGMGRQYSVKARGGRVYFAQTTGISALDPVTAKIVWGAALPGATLIEATDDAVYALADDTIHAFDAATGAALATFAVADSQVVYADTRGVIACDERRMFALGPAGAVLPVEHATITGRLLCRGCNRSRRVTPLGNVAVTAGGVTAMTDARGDFRIVVGARGTIKVTFDLPDIERHDLMWDGLSRTVRLRGARHYALGAIGARQRSMSVFD